MNWSWLSFVVGILVGWLLEWLIDFIFWRRKHRTQQAEIERLQQQIGGEQSRQRDLETQAIQCSRDLDACRVELETSRADLGASRAELEASRAELEASRADLKACRADLEAAESAAEEMGTRAGETPVPIELDAEEGQAAAEDATRAGAAVATAAAVGVVAAAGEPAPEQQDLTKIEGIGPKTKELLYQAGIVNLKQLSDTPPERLQEILEAAGPRYRVINPGTWPAQAQLAAEERWDDLEVLQSCIVNGVIVKHDLTKIEGIGPKIEGLFNDQEMVNYNQVAAAPVERLQGILDAAGPRYRMADPSSWPQQARLAADGEWDELDKLQTDLKGGRVAQEDLKQIEGIGPKIEGLLNEAGIINHWQLADTPVSRLKEILDAAGPRYRMADPSTWPEQSRLADEKKWDELQALQDRIKGGRDAREDLTRIEGVGPKISELLQEAGLLNFALLAEAPVERLAEILDAAGLGADPSTWPEQARLAAEGAWDELEALQDRLSGGREVDESNAESSAE